MPQAGPFPRPPPAKEPVRIPTRKKGPKLRRATGQVLQARLPGRHRTGKAPTSDNMHYVNQSPNRYICRPPASLELAAPLHLAAR